MKAMATGSVWGLKAIPALKLTWAVPVFVIAAIFVSKTGLIPGQHIRCYSKLNALAKENLEFQKQIEDGTLLLSLTAASFKVSVAPENADILRMTPAAMALQIQQLREISTMYHATNTRLIQEKAMLTQEKDRMAHSLATHAAISTSAAEGEVACESRARALASAMSNVKDEIELVKTEHLSTKSKLDEVKDQLKNSDALLDAATKELKLTRAKLAESAEAKAKCEAVNNAPVPGTGGLVVTPSRDFQGYQCEATEEDMKRYLTYKPHAACPNDWYFVQRLIFKKNCFALPRRRCRAPTPARPADPLPFPQSLFDQNALKNRNVRWDFHQYKTFEELNTRKAGDCRQCFNLGLEDARWKKPYRGTIPMQQVVEMKKGTLRLGIDIGGGTGSFAAHMAKHGVTVMTSAFNVETIKGKKAGLPYMETIAARGLIPLYVPHASRLPLYDGVLDLVHSVNSIKYVPLLQFEELIYEWDRVLRVGGIFWFEMFYAPVEDMPKYVAIIEKLNFKKLYWNFSPKPDRGEKEGEHVYLNCVLEKQPFPGNQVMVSPLPEDMEGIL